MPTYYLNKIIDEERPWGFKPDTKENLLSDLEKYTLDPTFEWYGNFINYNPEWTDSEAAEKYKDYVSIFGNFYTYSHAFNIVTDDMKLVKEIEQAVNRNKDTAAYKKAREEVMKRMSERKQKYYGG